MQFNNQGYLDWVKVRRLPCAALGAIALFAALLAPRAEAGMFEFSLAGSYSKSTYSAGNYEWTRRYGVSFGYHLTETSEIELSFQDVVDRTNIVGYEDTTFHDQIYALSWVQSFFGKNEPFQPYVKVGIGQLNQEATGNYAYASPPPAILDSVTGILGAGLRVYLTRQFALRGEATTYLTEGHIATWKDNVSITAGVSIYF